jgi:hypothetical protein
MAVALPFHNIEIIPIDTAARPIPDSGLLISGYHTKIAWFRCFQFFWQIVLSNQTIIEFQCLWEWKIHCPFMIPGYWASVCHFSF